MQVVSQSSAHCTKLIVAKKLASYVFPSRYTRNNYTPVKMYQPSMF